MKSGDHVIITKSGPSEGNALNGLVIGYEVEGFLECDVEVGRRMFILRWRRNSTRVMGEFISSPVISIRDTSSEDMHLVETENSTYVVHVIQYHPDAAREEAVAA